MWKRFQRKSLAIVCETIEKEKEKYNKNKIGNRNRKKEIILEKSIANRKKIPPLDFEMHSSYFFAQTSDP